MVVGDRQETTEALDELARDPSDTLLLNSMDALRTEIRKSGLREVSRKSSSYSSE
jgi:hypothetical protein